MVVSNQTGPIWPDRGNSFWVTKLADGWRSDRADRFAREGLEARDFDDLANIGFLRLAVPKEQGGAWESVPRSVGPIADALWHVGQVVTFRRSSGNPFNSKASVFTGKVRQ